MNLFAYRSRSYKRQVWNFNNVNITNMNWELSELDWISLCGNTRDIDEIYSRWYGYFRLIIGKYIPLETVTIRAKDKPWMDSKVRLSFRRRAACSEFTINAHLQPRGNAIGLNVT